MMDKTEIIALIATAVVLLTLSAVCFVGFPWTVWLGAFLFAWAFNCVDRVIADWRLRRRLDAFVTGDSNR